MPTREKHAPRFCGIRNQKVGSLLPLPILASSFPAEECNCLLEHRPDSLE